MMPQTHKEPAVLFIYCFLRFVNRFIPLPMPANIFLKNTNIALMTGTITGAKQMNTTRTTMTTKIIDKVAYPLSRPFGRNK